MVGKALVGTATELIAGDGESPLRSKRLKPFLMIQTLITNAQLAEFIAATGYVTAAEWEHAARGGQGDVPFPWGHDAPDDIGHFLCNIWQGRFPQNNTLGDGYPATAPAQSLAANGYGLYNVVGNVW